ncbi:MAG: hypothetical protein HY077_15550 [Elusimicrobia bacterium]|nr:hypothetical protein [Elusimicrobiota bacterium]
MSGLLLLAVLACGAQSQARAADMAEKLFGVLLLGEGGDKDWKDAADSIKKEMAKKKLPFEFAMGQGDGKAVQKAVDRLESLHVKKIVAVPLLLSSYSEEMDQDRYLLGIREKPSQEFAAAPHSHNRAAGAQARVKAKVPVVLTKGLDDSEMVVDILAARARALSHDPSKEILVLVGKAPASKEGLKDWVSTVDALAEKVRQKSGFRRAQGAALRDGIDRRARDASEAEVHKAVAALHRTGPVIVIPLELSPDLVHNRMPHILEGIQVRYDGKGILPDPRIAKWVEDSAEEGAKLPEMSVFKDGAKGPALTRAPSQLKGGSQLGSDSPLKNKGGY